MVKLVLLDNHRLIGMGLRALLATEPDFELIGEGSSFAELPELCRECKPDVILSEIALKDGELLAAMPDVLKLCSYLLVLTANKDRNTHLNILHSGAAGIVTKEQNLDILLKAIRVVSLGEVWFERQLVLDYLRGNKASITEVADEKIELEKKRLDQFNLTARELEIAGLAVQGLSAKKIAAKLFVSDKTVRNQLVMIYSKLGVTGQVDLVCQAAKLGLSSESS